MRKARVRKGGGQSGRVRHLLGQVCHLAGLSDERLTRAWSSLQLAILTCLELPEWFWFYCWSVWTERKVAFESIEA